LAHAAELASLWLRAVSWCPCPPLPPLPPGERSAMPHCRSLAAAVRRRDRAVALGYFKPPDDSDRKLISVSRRLAPAVSVMAQAVEAHDEIDKRLGVRHHSLAHAVLAARPQMSDAEFAGKLSLNRRAGRAKHCLPPLVEGPESASEGGCRGLRTGSPLAAPSVGVASPPCDAALQVRKGVDVAIQCDCDAAVPRVGRPSLRPDAPEFVFGKEVAAASELSGAGAWAGLVEAQNAAIGLLAGRLDTVYSELPSFKKIRALEAKINGVIENVKELGASLSTKVDERVTAGVQDVMTRHAPITARDLDEVFNAGLGKVTSGFDVHIAPIREAGVASATRLAALADRVKALEASDCSGRALAKGDLVILAGLRSVEANGKVAKVLSDATPEEERVGVRLIDADKTYRVKQVNCYLIAPAAGQRHQESPPSAAPRSTCDRQARPASARSFSPATLADKC